MIWISSLMALALVFVIGAIVTKDRRLDFVARFVAEIYIVPVFLSVVAIGIALLPIIIIETIVMKIVRRRDGV